MSARPGGPRGQPEQVYPAASPSPDPNPFANPPQFEVDQRLYDNDSDGGFYRRDTYNSDGSNAALTDDQPGVYDSYCKFFYILFYPQTY